MTLVWQSASVFDNADQDDHDTRGWRSLVEAVMALGPPEWHRDALCREPDYSAEWWFPVRGSAAQMDLALEVCSQCLVVAECRAAGVADRDSAGIWGGTTANARKGMRRGAA